MRSAFRFQVFDITDQELKALKKYELIDQSVFSRHTLYIAPKKALETIMSLDEKADQRQAPQGQVQEMSEKLDTLQNRLSEIERELAEANADRNQARNQLKKTISENERLKRENTELKNTTKRLEEQIKSIVKRLEEQKRGEIEG